MSHRETQRTDVGPINTDRTTWFEQDFTWTDLGDLETVDYPTCVIPSECTGAGNPSGQPSRTIAHGYGNGFLTSVSEGAATIADVSYHANEMLAQINFGGTATEWTQDPDSMRRPAQIFTARMRCHASVDRLKRASSSSR